MKVLSLEREEDGRGMNDRRLSNKVIYYENNYVSKNQSEN
jgi:hypothetical protein